MHYPAGFIFVAALALSGAAKAATCPAENFIQSAGSAFMGAAHSGSPQAFSSAASRFADLRGISLFALGQYRHNLPAGREGEYVAKSRVFMGRFLAQYSSQFSGSGIAITTCDSTSSRLTVGAKLTGGQSVTFRLRGGNGSYRVEDVSVSSVWIAQALRSEYTEVISNHGGDVGALIDWLGH